MPTYDYRCETCGRAFEHFQSMNDPRLETCQFPDCEGKVKRLLGTGAGIIFKGSGFYQTDYRSESYKKGAESASKNGSESKSKGKGKSKKEGSKTEKGSSTSSSSSAASSGSGGSQKKKD